MSEARMREIIRDQFATSMNEFMANMNSRAGGSGGASGSGGAGGSGGTGGNADVTGAGPTVPELTGCTYATFIKCDPLLFNGTEGAVGLCQWFEKLELVFQISECKEKDRVKFAMATLRGRALTWWNGRTKDMGIKAANNTPWSEVRKWMTEEFCARSVIQRMEQELYNLRMKGMDIDGYTNRFHELALLFPLAYQLVGQLIQDKANEATESEKRKGEGDRGSRGDNRRHKTERYRTLEMNSYNCKEKGHRKRDCPKEDPKVVTGTFLLNNHYATTLFDSGADRSFVSTKFGTLINIKPVEIDTSYEVELADGHVIDSSGIHVDLAKIEAIKSWAAPTTPTECTVYTNHKSLQYIMDQKELNMRQRRWIELLSDYDCEIRYHPRKANMVDDALSRKDKEPICVRALVVT
nr:putative zinc finger, CCHC-type, retrotransposon Gag domain protein [Tanacetum cinerariifolium]